MYDIYTHMDHFYGTCVLRFMANSQDTDQSLTDIKCLNITAKAVMFRHLISVNMFFKFMVYKCKLYNTVDTAY